MADKSKMSVAEILAAADRIRYLTRQLHAEMFAEIWSPGDPSPEYGIDVRTLELPASDVAVLDVLRRAEVMDELARWDAGSALGNNTRDRVGGASAVAVAARGAMSCVEDKGRSIQRCTSHLSFFRSRPRSLV